MARRVHKGIVEDRDVRAHPDVFAKARPSTAYDLAEVGRMEDGSPGDLTGSLDRCIVLEIPVTGETGQAVRRSFSVDEVDHVAVLNRGCDRREWCRDDRKREEGGQRNRRQVDSPTPKGKLHRVVIGPAAGILKAQVGTISPIVLTIMFRFTTGITTALAILALTALVAGAVPPGGTFIDDDGNVHEANIEALACCWHYSRM